MGRVCTICVHPAGADIETALKTNRSLRDIAAEFGVSKTALHRHWQAHTPGQDLSLCLVSEQVPCRGAARACGPMRNGRLLSLAC
jgi:hypothetical protein